MKNLIKAFLLSIIAGVPLCAHPVIVTGTIVDENKEPVIGATVKLKGNAKIGIATDIDGKFSLDVPESELKDGALVISYVGYETRRIPLNGRTIISTDLIPQANELNEIVVVGYGSMKKSDLTGSLSSVKTSDTEAASTTSFDKLLQGKAAGVYVTTGSAAPGGSTSVRIRGTGSLRGDNSPLYVIDGNIISNLGDTSDPMGAGQNSGNSRKQEQDPLASINPQDIESIEVLKDASATAIYGSQGANGVILITTKRGKTAKPNITVSATVTMSKLAKEIPMLDFNGYMSFRNSPEFLNGSEPTSSEGLIPVNWQRNATHLAVSQNYRASISGKNKKTGYFLALGYANQEGVIRKTGVKKYDIRVNLDQELNDYLSLKSSSFFSHIGTTMTSGTDKLANTRTSIVRQMISYKPYINPTDNGEEYTEYDENITSPEVWFTDYDDDSREDLFNTSLVLDYKPLKWMTLRAKGGVVYKNKSRSMWYGKKTFNGAQSNGKAGLAEMTSNFYNAEFMAMFDHKFNKKHSINGTLGVVYDNKQIKQTGITGEDFFSEDLRADGISQAAKQYPFKLVKTGQQLFSVLARAVYNYDNRYLLTATFRADGSSKFDKHNRFSYFPSFAAAWRMNKEKWMSGLDWLSNLKIRAGWGRVGNQAISPYQILANYNNVTGVTGDGQPNPGIVPSRIPNPDLKWETSEQFNVGVDFGVFNQRLTFTADAYIKNTKDLLQEIATPYASGYSTMYVNNGKITNKGLEFTIEGVPYTSRDWEVNLGANMSITSNKIKELGMAPSNFGMLHNEVGYWGQNVGNNTFTKFPANVFLVNHSIGLFMGYETNGILQQSTFDSPEYQAKPLVMNGTRLQPGDVLYVDQNNDGVIDDKDRVILGNPNPDFTFAFNASVRYKRFTLGMVFNGVVGNEIINANLIDETDVKNANNNVRADAFYNAWRADNPSNEYPRLGYQPSGVLSDRIIENGSYLRLAQLSLDYRLDFKKSKYIKGLTLNFTASNLFTVSSYSGYDPDVNTFSNDADRMGVDLTSYPTARNFTFGVIANF